MPCERNKNNRNKNKRYSFNRRMKHTIRQEQWRRNQVEEKDEENKSLFGRLKRRNTMEEDTNKLDNNGKKSPVTKARRLARDDEVERLKAECRSLREPPEVKAGGVSRSRSSST
ncbi:hypothetical protein RhiirB3_433630 [Rhizophagus irregularis]|nr:hypothetical protein RhiirB3_433630 [Rhizophagus irregularis]